MKISIITVCYNSEKKIKDTIESVLNQTYKNYEYIIVDGKSKDNTLNIIKKYEKKFKGKLRYISEKDKGIFDAMNKGVQMSTGDIIGFINSDDILANNFVFEKIIRTFENNNCYGVYSDLLFMNENLEVPVRNFIAHNCKKKFGWHPPHPTLYLKKEVYNKVGNFNIQYKICSDLDFMLRVIKQDYKLIYIKEYFVIMRAGGVSTNGLKGYINNLKEANVVLKNQKIKAYYFDNILRIFKTIYQGLNAKILKRHILNKVKQESCINKN